MPTKLGKALIFGKAWHEALAVVYDDGTYEDALTVGLGELETAREQYKRLEDYQADTTRFPMLFRKWHEVMLPILAGYRVLETEVELKPVLRNGFVMTIRPDAILEELASGRVFIAEHKTTSWSTDNMVHTVENQDQATAYIWGVGRAKPDYLDRMGGVLLDVTYNRSSVVEVSTHMIYRSARDLAEFELSMAGLFTELGQKYLAAKQKTHPLPMLFPRNGSACSQFGCEYETICRGHLDENTPIGEDFLRDPWYGGTQTALEHLGAE